LKDKVEMEDEIRAKVVETLNTRIVCRRGNPMDLNDLEIVTPHLARSIIVLPPEGSDPDVFVIKTTLALTNNPQRHEQPYHIVASLNDRRNLDVANLVGKGEAQLLLADVLISRIIAQTCRQTGLSVIYTELLDFAGDEIYFQAEPALTGLTFGEILCRYEDSTVIGLALASGSVQLNPSMDTRLEAGDRIIAISADDDTVRLSGQTNPPVDTAAILSSQPTSTRSERTLILGWNKRAPIIINELDRYVAPGSQILVVADSPDVQDRLDCDCGSLVNQTVLFRSGDTTDRRVLDGLEIATFQHVILLSYASLPDIQEADARTLVTLLHLRDIEGSSQAPFSIVSEMLDIRNRELAKVTRVDDFIVSDKLISLMLAQVSENKDLAGIFEDLFDPDGSEIYLKRAAEYVQLDHPVNFYTVLESARRRGEVAIGYRLIDRANQAAEAYGVRLNPKKSDRISFSAGDRVIVLAEE
jgi:voltage-gated potassium channel Kch